MVTQQQTAEFSGEVVRNGVATVTWCARPLEQSEALGRDRLANLHLEHNRDELQRAIQELTDSFRKRHEAIATVCSAFQDRLQKAAKNFPPGQEMDPDDNRSARVGERRGIFSQGKGSIVRCPGRSTADRGGRSTRRRGLRRTGTPGQAVRRFHCVVPRLALDHNDQRWVARSEHGKNV